MMEQEESDPLAERAAFHRMLMQNAGQSSALPKGRSPKAVFDKQLQAAYTHGLEHIYALENVDPSSIRLISTAEEPAKESLPPRIFRGDGQLTLDFGRGFRTWMEPLAGDEPIALLGLSSHAEKLLLDAGRRTIAQVRSFDLAQIGLGQGHVDEIRNKVESYLAGRELECDESLDIAALLRTMLCYCDIRGAYALFQEYQLEHLCPLPMSALAEVRRSPPGKIQQWQVEVIEAWRSEEATAFFGDKMSEAFQAFVLPWIGRRGGVASDSEVNERLYRIASDRTLVKPFLDLMDRVYGKEVIASCAPSVQHLHCASEWIARTVAEIIECIRGYFYRLEVFYPVAQLIGLVQRDFLGDWIEVSEVLLERILMGCPVFRVRMDPTYGRIVRLA